MRFSGSCSSGVIIVSQARSFTNRRGEGKGLVKLHRHFCSHYATKIVADMRSVASRCPGSEYSSSHCIATVAITSSNYINARDILETADRCRTTSSAEFHQTVSFPSSVGKGSGLRDWSDHGSVRREIFRILS